MSCLKYMNITYLWAQEPLDQYTNCTKIVCPFCELQDCVPYLGMYIHKTILFVLIYYYSPNIRDKSITSYVFCPLIYRFWYQSFYQYIRNNACGLSESPLRLARKPRNTKCLQYSIDLILLVASPWTLVMFAFFIKRIIVEITFIIKSFF